MPASTGVVPTPVGVNRAVGPRWHLCPGCPHACGGEPRSPPFCLSLHLVVPTPVGVNRSDGFLLALRAKRCPHACGGEPGSGRSRTSRARRCPHACGGEPALTAEAISICHSLSPRLWG